MSRRQVLAKKRAKQKAMERELRLIGEARKEGYERGYLAGVREAEEKQQLKTADESLRVRLKLAEAYAEVFKSIAQSSIMLFDGGLSQLTHR